MPRKTKRARNTKRVTRTPKRKNSPLLLFIVLLLVLLVPLLVFLGIQHQRNKAVLQAATKPNVIVIMTDDQPYEQSDPYMTTPIVKERLVSHGVTFNNAYIPTSVCCPSRASFLSGLYAHNTGVLNNTKKNGSVTHFRDNEDETIAVWMQNAGYKTALIGKYMNGYGDTPKRVPPGWSLWYAFVNPEYYDYRINENGHLKKFGDGNNAYSTDVLARRAVKFIQDTTDPFFLVFTPKAPHGSGGNGGDDDDGPKGGLMPPVVAKKYRGTCKNLDFTPPPSFNEEDRSDKPKWVQKLKKVSVKDVNKFRQNQLCSEKSVDDAVGEMLDALGPRLDNTVVIYYSDNGFSYGEHRYTKKNCFYEECAHVPMVISYPPLTATATVSNAFVHNIDLAPTIAELAGVTIPVQVDGKSLVPMLSDPNATVRDSMLLEILNEDKKFRGSGIRTAQYKYIELTTGEKELYDEQADPYEMQNIASDPANASIEADLATQLATLKQAGTQDGTSIQSDSGSPKAVTLASATVRTGNGNPFSFFTSLFQGFFSRLQ